ncbi:unnamed protein product [Leptosia nina]|uniref:27 kDa hemolymph protein n=1 Tax=Leptosia nina TaxID=320188 RepID=A0AAV1JXQ6_9NEOP
MFSSYFIFALIFGLVHSQGEPSIDEALNSLPPELQGKVEQKQLEAIQNKSVEIFKEKCEKNGGPGAYENAESASKGFSTCISALVNPGQLQQEIDEAKPKGQVDEVFKKYCDKTPDFRNCFMNMTDAVKPCFSEEERNGLKTVNNITEQLAEFICFKEGDRIALFIAENGPECIQEKQEDIQRCFNSTIGTSFNIGEGNFTADAMPKIAFGEKECGQFTELQKCVVISLETCSSPTSANIVESLFKFILKSTPCKEFIARDAAKKRAQSAQEEKKPNSAHSFALSGLALSAAVLKSIF